MRSRSAIIGTGIAAVLAGITMTVMGAARLRRWLDRRASRPRAASAPRGDRIDEAVEESFPASDPPSHAATLGASTYDR